MLKQNPIYWLDEYLLDKHHEEKEKILESGECKSVSEIRLMTVKKATILVGLSFPPVTVPTMYYFYQDFKILNKLGIHLFDSSKNERILGLVKFSIIFTVLGLPACLTILNEIITGDISILNFLATGSTTLALSGCYYILVKYNYYQNDDGKRRKRKSISEVVRERLAGILEGIEPVGEQALVPIPIPVKHFEPGIPNKNHRLD